MTTELAPLAVLGGVRTPLAKAFTQLQSFTAVDLGCHAVSGVLAHCGLAADQVDEVIFGNVAGQADSANLARVIALRSGVPQDRIAHTVNRNCGSGMESILAAWHAITEDTAGRARGRLIVAGGTESMSNIPMLLSREAVEIWLSLARAKSLGQRLGALANFRPRHFRPVSGIELGLTDPSCGLNMGQTAELLAQEFRISRQEQDEYALMSHQRAVAVQSHCFLSGEIVPMASPSGDEITRDNGPREQQTLEQLGKLRPLFQRDGGTITAGNSCPLTDGAAAVVVVDAQRADGLERPPLGYIRGYAIAGCDPRRMGLGPVYAIAKLLRQTGMSLEDFDRIELNEAFAAQVIACQRAAESATFCRQELGLDGPLGSLDLQRMNVNGGAVALGHPVGTSGTRLVLTLLRELRRAGLRRGLATLCVGGGQGMAMIVETQRER
jgi:acetyl-CoA acetyltransferase family protein